MPANPVFVAEGTPAATSTAVDVIERASTETFTTSTADPGAAGTTLAVTANARFPQTNGFRVRVENENMLVTAGAGTNSWTVTRAVDGTTGVAHAIGVRVSLLVGLQRVSPADERMVSYKGRSATFRVPGRAATAQNLFSIHNATGSTTIVDVESIMVDVVNAAAAGIAPTVIPPIIRISRCTVLPTNGTAATKVPEDTALASSASVTILQDASADGTSSATTLTATLGSTLTEEYAPRVLVVGTSASTFYEPFDRTTFFREESVSITLRALEGLVVNLATAATTGNPITNHYLITIRWTEYTL